MDANEFWEKVDHQLKTQGLTVSELSDLIGKSRNTVFAQRKNHNMPKADQIIRMEYYLRCRLLDDENQDDSFTEYLPYLRKAEEWQLKSVRQILNMPDVSPRSEADGESMSKAN